MFLRVKEHVTKWHMSCKDTFFGVIGVSSEDRFHHILYHRVQLERSEF